MSKRFLFLLPLLFAAKGYSQTGYSLSNYYLDSAKIAVGISGEFLINSTVLTNEFFGKFINGGYIDKELKDKISGKLLLSNRLGGDVNYGLFYAQRINRLFGKPFYRFNYFVSITNRQHFDVRFNENLFKLGFYGNKQFAGDTVDAGNFSLNMLGYQQFQLGFISDNGMGGKFGMGLSFLKGETQNSIEAAQLEIYTSDIGDVIDISTNARISRSDTATTGIEAFNGWGLSIDLMYEYNFNVFSNSDEGIGMLRLEISDLGFIRWNEQSFNYTLDTSFHYEGLVIDNVFELHDSILTQTIDSITESYTSHQLKSGHTTVLPAIFRFTVIQQKGRHVFTLGMMYRIAANYNPFVFLKETYRFNEVFSLGGKVSYGGYGKFGFGLEAGISFKKFRLLIGSNHLDGLILPKITSGYSGYVAFDKRF